MIASITETHLFETLFQAGARLISLARPGYGGSSPYPMENVGEWADLASVLIDELNLSAFDVLGTSSGAPYAYAIGHNFPNKARNLFIFSGVPALYDEEIQSHWPYPMPKDTSMEEMQALAHQLFFSNLSKEDLEDEAVNDSMANGCFGVAQDLMLRGRGWGFCLE
jgi:pimeloyl-ACP methyl ester carboxylesterase